MTNSLESILKAVQDGQLDIAAAMSQLRDAAASPLGFATIDHARGLRCGHAEVVYAAGKSPEQVAEITRHLLEHEPAVLVTRADAAHVEAIAAALPGTPIERSERGGTVIAGQASVDESLTPIPIVTAGTSDQPVAEEAALTCKALGHPTVRIHDVGVAGIHRLVNRLEEMRGANAIVCIAGMEGALPSVVGGMVDVPVLAVPTSVGYGANFAGLTALLGMLTSCASGVSVVNIDNGFGAAYSACLINQRVCRAES